MENSFSDRISDVPRSFIREILKVALDQTVISFAGGLPNRYFFPAEGIKEATRKVFDIHGRDIFQNRLIFHVLMKRISGRVSGISEML